MFKVITTVYSPDYNDQDLLAFRESSWQKIVTMYEEGFTNGENNTEYFPDSTVFWRAFVDQNAAEEWRDWLIANVPEKWKDKLISVIEETV